MFSLSRVSSRLMGLAILVGVSASAFAQWEPEREKIPLSGQIGVYYPSNGEMRQLIGSQVLSIGLRPGGARVSKAGTISFDIDAVTGSRDGNKVFLLPVTGTYTYLFNQDEFATTVPYARLHAGLAYMDYALTRTDPNRGAVGRQSAKVIGGTGGIEAGLLFNNNLRLSARYNWFTEPRGFNFNGLQFEVSYVLFRL
ncbi:MAG: hypothetical protein ACK4XJ_01650 [Fimbriimonadaceae bacterium]